MTNSVKIDDEEEKVSKDSEFILVLISTFSTIFIAELGDKTQIATLLLSAQSGKPIIVFIGAALALIISSLIGVILGRWIANNLPKDKFAYSAGILMICLGLWLGFQGIKGYISFKELI